MLVRKDHLNFQSSFYTIPLLYWLIRNFFSLFGYGLLREKDCEEQMARIFFIIISVLWLPYTIVYIFAKCISALDRLPHIPYAILVYPPKRSGIF